MWEDLASFMGPLVLGIFITMAVEAITGRAWGMLVRQRFLARAKKQHRIYEKDDELIRRGEDSLYVLEFVPEGWRPDELTIDLLKAPPLMSELLRADSKSLPEPPDALIASVKYERERLSTFPNGEWNGESLGILGILTSRSKSSERPLLKIEVYKSDHAAAVAVGRSWTTSIDAGRIQFPEGPDKYIPGLGHAIGLNATVVTDDNQLVLVRRSSQASSGRSGWHISVNEAMTADDRVLNRKLDARIGVTRGIKEELGLDVGIANVTLHTAMFDVRRYQFGLLGHVDLRGTGITAAQVVRARQSGLSKDRFENSHIKCVEWNFQSVLKMLQEPDWIAHGWLNLVNSAITSLPLDQKAIGQLLDSRLLAK